MSLYICGMWITLLPASVAEIQFVCDNWRFAAEVAGVWRTTAQGRRRQCFHSLQTTRRYVASQQTTACRR